MGLASKPPLGSSLETPGQDMNPGSAPASSGGGVPEEREELVMVMLLSPTPMETKASASLLC